MAVTRSVLVTVASIILVVFLANKNDNVMCFNSDTDPDVPVFPTISPDVTYFEKSNTLIVDDARWWQVLDPHSTENTKITILNWILWITTLGSSTLEYAPYYTFDKIITEDDMVDTAVMIGNSATGPHSLTVTKLVLSSYCHFEEDHHRLNISQWEKCLHSSSSYTFYTDAFYRNSNGDISGHHNCTGGITASPAEIVSDAMFTFVLWWWVVMVLGCLFSWVHEKYIDVLYHRAGVKAVSLP